MESIGARLQQTRESKGYTIEQIARDTHIAKRFLEALEQEDFDQFPGEPYLIGFLRTYSEYLGLQPQEMVALYRNLQLQEQPAPMDELIVRRSSAPLGLIFGIVAGVVIVAGAIYLLAANGVFSGRDRTSDQDETSISEQAEPTGDTIDMSVELIEQRFHEGDRILVPVRDRSVPIDLVSVGETLGIMAGETPMAIPIAEETAVDLDGDGVSDVRITVRSLDVEQSPRSVVMRLDRGMPVTTGEVSREEVVGSTDVETPVVGSTTEPSRIESARVIAEFDEREEFSVEIRFTGYCLFRYEADDEPRVERYFQRDEVLVTSARDTLRIWASNADAARLRVAGQDISLGRPGEVTAAMLTWASSPDSQNVRLELIPVY